MRVYRHDKRENTGWKGDFLVLIEFVQHRKIHVIVTCILERWPRRRETTIIIQNDQRHCQTAINMAARFNLLTNPRILVFRPRIRVRNELFNRPTNVARFSSKTDGAQSAGTNTDPLPSVSEEAAATSKAKGERGPELQQGTPVQEMLKRDKEALENAPKVMKEDIKQQTGKRSFSTMTSRRQDLVQASQNKPADIIPSIPPSVSTETKESLPPLKPQQTLVGRYPAIIEQFVGLIMRNGEKSVAQQVKSSSTLFQTSP
jgi:small subunit ribosomal protein S7